MSNIAIFTPNQNPYSETFIQAHKNYLKGNVYYYYGKKNIQLEGHPPLASDNEKRFLNFQRQLFGKPHSFIQETLILKSLKKNKIDVVLAEYGYHAHFILPIVKRANLPLVVHFHGFDASSIEVLKLHENYKDLFKFAAKVIAVSEKMETMLLEIGCPPDKLVYNVYGPQPEFLEVAPTFLKQQFIAIGRFADKKAPYYTILAFAKVLENYPATKLIMAGDGVLLNTCKNLIKYLKIENQVEFLGVITSERYRELLSESLGFVQHSITTETGDMEGTPLSVLEASAAGLPVIATNHAGIPDVIEHNKTGLLCEEHDVDAMAENLLAILNDLAFAQKLGSAGKNNITKNFSMERHIKKLQKVLELCKI